MKIAYLKMTNFMLYKKFHKNFENIDVCGIICEYRDNKNKSNRGGKTTILEAIKYALHGNTRAKREIKLIHFGEEFMEVELGLIDEDGNIFKIRRGRDHKNNGLLECDWVDKKKEAQEEINKLIGCDGKELELINYFKQSDINKFMLLPANEKKDHLMKWFNNTHWNKLWKAVDIDLKVKRVKLAKNHTKKEAILEDLGDIDTFKNRIKKTKKKIKKKKGSLQLLIDKKKKLNKKSKSEEDIEELEDKVSYLWSDISSLNSDIFANQGVKDKVSELVYAKKELEKELKGRKYIKSLYREYVQEQAKAEKEKELLEELLAKMKGKFCGICPVLNEGCDRIKKDPKKIKAVKKEIKDLDADCQNFQEHIEDMDEVRDMITAVNEVDNVALQMKSKVKPAKPLKKKLKALELKYEALYAELAEAKSVDNVIEIHAVENKIDDKEKGLDELHQKLGQYKSRIKQIEKANEKVSKINKSIKKLEVEIEDLKYLYLMFGKNGIPSQEIENAFCEIESDINFLLKKITSFEVSFSADKELDKWESECVSCGWTYRKGYRKKECEECGEPRNKKRKDELHLTIVEHGYESDFEMDSGGGMTFISLAVRIALTMLKKRQTNSQLDVVFLDEIDSALDDDAREQIMKLVWLLIKSLGFKQVFWVSHNKQIKESVPHTLKVIRLEKNAKAVWV